MRENVDVENERVLDFVYFVFQHVYLHADRRRQRWFTHNCRVTRAYRHSVWRIDKPARLSVTSSLRPYHNIMRVYNNIGSWYENYILRQQFISVPRSTLGVRSV